MKFLYANIFLTKVLFTKISGFTVYARQQYARVDVNDYGHMHCKKLVVLATTSLLTFDVLGCWM